MAFKRVIIRRVGPLFWLLDGLELFSRVFQLSRLHLISVFFCLYPSTTRRLCRFVTPRFLLSFGLAYRRLVVLAFLPLHFGRKLRLAVAAQASPALCFQAMKAGEPVICFLRPTYRAMF